jgi:hypothetical protein
MTGELLRWRIDRGVAGLAAVQVTFVDANRRPLGELRLPSVGPLERLSLDHQTPA